MRRIATAWLILVAVSAHVAAQEPSALDQTAVGAAWKAQDDDRLLEADAILRARAFDAAGKPVPGLAYDQWAQLQSLLTNVPAQGIPSSADPATVEPPAPGTDQIASAVPHDAIAAIVERARRTRVVILNEDHASPRDRAFALEVARALRPLGYDLLGAETFNNDPDRARSTADMAKLARDGYPRRFTGVYTRDPVFGDFVRQSLALGYRPFAYETTDYSSGGSRAEQIARRERDQADNIARVLREHPRSKLFVYVGFHHATERPAPDGSGGTDRWMATRLKAMTHIDPLTIDQTMLNDSGAGDRSLYNDVRPKLGDRPAILFAGGGPLVLGTYNGLVDLQVAHPPLERVSGRPTWLAQMDRTATPIPAELLPKTGRRLVKAFVESEAEDAIPIDQVLVTAGRPALPLMLPQVPIRYAVEDEPPKP